ncbi:MAG: UDP-2,3-diacylglucosamine diphosphatase LpxI [Hyphomicrobiaceae bacterium]
MTRGYVLCVEAAEGTDDMLDRAKRPGGNGARASGRVLVKMVKPGQELRADLPTIGPRTIELAAEGAASPVSPSRPAVFSTAARATIAAADACGLFLVGFAAEMSFCTTKQTRCRFLRVFIVAGEHSGDRLGGKLMLALREVTDGAVVFGGVGATQMRRRGAKPCSTSPMSRDGPPPSPSACCCSIGAFIRRSMPRLAFRA